MSVVEMLFMQLKCFFGHFGYPILEHGRQVRFFTSNDCQLVERYGYIPKAGMVFPQITAVGLLKAAAMCMRPVSGVITLWACLMIDAEPCRVNLPHREWTCCPALLAMCWPLFVSCLPPSNIIGAAIFLQSSIVFSIVRCFVVCAALMAMAM